MFFQRRNTNGGLATAQKVKCWPDVYKALGGVLRSVVHPCNPGTQEVETGGLKVTARWFLG